MEKEAGEALAVAVIIVAIIVAVSCFIGKIMDGDGHTPVYRDALARCESLGGHLSATDKCYVNGEEK